jgi:mannan endo-1,4-beta-mannosidase
MMTLPIFPVKSFSAVARLLLPIVATAMANFATAAEPAFSNFITAHNGKLFDGGQEFRFVSWNIPNLLIIEDNYAWDAPNDWLLPDEFELTDAFASVRQLGGTVVRSYSLPIQRADEDASIPKYIRGLGQYNEDAFRTLDLALKLANAQHIRLILPLVNNWPWQGGRGDLAAWRGKTKDDFWTDPQLIADFEDIVRHVLTRTNTLTGVRYLDDKAILCWETGNELRGPSSWTKTIAEFIKGVDTNHLVMDGYDAGIRPEVLEMPAVDIVTTHHYPSSQNPKTIAEQIRDDAKLVNARKAYIIGEFGFVKTDEMGDAMKAIEDSPVSGGLLWSLRFRDRNGGFYWHSEPDGANLYKAFHWPPSSFGDPYDETKLVGMVRAAAFAIRGLPEPQVPVPAAPKLLPIADAGAISWQGSVGARSYQVERAAGMNGDWTVISSNIDEAFTQYRPQFADEKIPSGKWFYRVRAGDEAGISEPSNIVGPVDVKTAWLVDELADFSKTSSHSGGCTIADRNCRVTKEDIHRVAGSAGGTLTYKLPSAIDGLKVYAFFEKNVSPIKFSVSDDGAEFHEITAQMENVFHGPGDYNYWKPVLFHTESVPGGKFLKMELTGDTQISRVEISRKALPK